MLLDVAYNIDLSQLSLAESALRAMCDNARRQLIRRLPFDPTFARQLGVGLSETLIEQLAEPESVVLQNELAKTLRGSSEVKGRAEVAGGKKEKQQLISQVGKHHKSHRERKAGRPR